MSCDPMPSGVPNHTQENESGLKCGIILFNLINLMFSVDGYL